MKDNSINCKEGNRTEYLLQWCISSSYISIKTSENNDNCYLKVNFFFCIWILLWGAILQQDLCTWILFCKWLFSEWKWKERKMFEMLIAGSKHAQARSLCNELAGGERGLLQNSAAPQWYSTQQFPHMRESGKPKLYHLTSQMAISTC